MQRGIDFWFSIGSTYTYLTVARLEDVAKQHDIDFHWHPFDIQPIMKEQKNFPFSNKPIKAAYMWRDVSRRAALYGIPARVPAPYPPAEIELANRIAVVGKREGWCSAYVKTTYHRWFVHGEVVGGEVNILHSLREIDQDVTRVYALASSAAIEAELKSATDQARALQIFGSPSFVVRGEVFWGDDRLDDAIRWFRFETLRR